MHRNALPVLVLTLSAQLPWNADAKDDSRPRLFVAESESWSMGDERGIPELTGPRDVIGGARPQTAEIVKTVHDRCPYLIITRKEERADYVLVLEHDGGKDILRRDNKFALYDAEGDAIASGSTRSLGNAVKDACKAIAADWDEAQ